jgi:hypothetical protein
MSFFKNREQEGKQSCLEVGTSGQRAGGGRGGCKERGKGWRRGIWWKYYVLMYGNGKLRSVENYSGNRGRGDKRE